MDQLTLKPRKAVVLEDEIENWDDDDLDIGGDELTFRSASLATTALGSHHRDSVSSRLSGRSFDSNHGDEDRHVHLPGDDERSTIDAIATAARAGIPIPQNVPSSALTGGTIKRLGGRRLKKIIQDDWDDGDLDLSTAGDAGLQLKQPDASKFPDALRQVSGPGSLQSSPAKGLQPAPKFTSSPKTLKPKVAASNLLERFRDDEEDDDMFGDGGATIKVPKSRQVPKLLPLVTPPTPQKNQDSTEAEDDFEKDLQLPTDGRPLRLSARKDIPKTPINAQDEFDEWGEGSLGTRFGGTRRDGRSNRSSSVSALSPSVASSLTIESEDEGLDGLVLPEGPLNFEEILKRRKEDRSPDHLTSQKPPPVNVTDKKDQDDFLSGLEIGDGDVFSSKKLNLNRNVKIKTVRQPSPTRPKTAVSLTFSNKPTLIPGSRLPRPLGGHERIPSQLAPVSESGGPIAARTRRSQSRLGHSAQSSISSVHTPTTPSSIHSLPPSTPRRRDLGNKSSFNALRNEPTTTNSQLLKLKRSMPTIKPYTQSPIKPTAPRYERPPSRTETSSRAAMSRPKTPVERDRSGAESSMSHARRNPLPFLPAGNSSSQSHHVTIKSSSSRHFRRHDSESSNASTEFRPSSRAVSRTTMRSPSPRRNARGAEALAREAAAKRQMTKPVRRRHFGDGNELDAFDDLPTSRDHEQKFIKEPVGRGPPKQSSLRNKIHQEILPARTTTPAPFSPARPDLPRFARDTNASRMAREQTITNRAPSGGAPLAALTNQWKSKISANTGLNSGGSVRSKKPKGPPQKPQLIKPLGSLNNPKSLKGMYYNPYTYRWEGNENEVDIFDAPASSPSISTASIPSHMIREKDHPSQYREKENTTPRPALITNINSSQNVQVVGGMVFDPQRMCWLKMPASSQKSGKSEGGDTMDGFDAFDDEEDVFKDVPDLEDEKKDESVGGRKSEGLKDDWLVGEEFDVGPEFVRRQREEEERWRRKCEKWVGAGRDLERGGDVDWRWSIRDVVSH